MFEMLCAFLPLFNPNIDLLQAVKVTKSGHHLFHDWESKGYGSIPCLTSQTSLHACLQRLNTMQISLWHQKKNRPMPLTSLVVWRMMARFCNFYNVKKSRVGKSVTCQMFTFKVFQRACRRNYTSGHIWHKSGKMLLFIKVLWSAAHV